MATQTTINFPDTCPSCKGLGVIPFTMTIVMHGDSIIFREGMRPCNNCDSKGILNARYLAKLQLSSLYGKFMPSNVPRP